ncbi:MAG: tetratricopeptide repeat protein [Flavobacteriales bacterium]|nr:tetratricopeptide repeat protein [Flavobacteriales bacterium]
MARLCAARAWRISALLGIFAFLLYINTIPNDYSVDDTKSAGQNEQVKKGLAGIPEILTTLWDFSEDPNTGEIGYFEYRPISKITFAIEYELFGANPHISHGINSILYGLIVALLLIVLRRTASPSEQTAVLILATLIFAAHPIHTEVVANLKNREVLLGFLLGLISWWVMIPATQGGKVNLGRMALAFFLFSLGVASKMDAGIFAIVIPGSLWFFNKATIKTAVLLGFGYVVCFLLVKLMPSIWLPEWHRVYYYWENPAFKDPSWQVRATIVFNSFLYNLRLLVFPHPLSFYYGFNTVPFGKVFSSYFIAGISLFVLLVVLTFYGILRRRMWSFGLAVFFVGIAPFLNVVLPVTGIIADRYLFVSSLGFCIATSALGVNVYQGVSNRIIKLGFWVIMVGTIGLMVTKVLTRNQDWENRLTLYRKDACSYPNSAKVNVMLGYRLSSLAKESTDNEIRSKLLNEALVHFQKAKTILPTMESVNGDIGYAHMELGNYVQAIRAYNEELALEYNDVNVHNNLGVLYLRLGLLEPSVDHFEMASRIDSMNLNIRVDMLSAYIFGDMKSNVEKEISFIEQNDSALNVPFVEVADYFLRTRKDTCKAIGYYIKASDRGFDEPGYESWLLKLTSLKACTFTSTR